MSSIIFPILIALFFGVVLVGLGIIIDKLTVKHIVLPRRLTGALKKLWAMV